MTFSALHYRGTSDEVRLGDHVCIRRLFWRKETGTVCYIPGISPIHAELEYDDVRQWAIRTDNGNVYAILYDPQNFPPPKNISLLARGAGSELIPDEQIG